MAYRLRIVIDVLLAACFVAAMATALVEEAPHEFLGLALLVLVVVHVVLNRRMLAAYARGRYSAVRVLQLAAVVGLAACLVGQAVSVVVLSKHALAFLPALPGASWARTVHMLCSYWSFVLAFAHVGLQLKSMFARVRGGRWLKPAARWAVRAAVAAVAAFGAVSFMQLGLPAYLTAQVQFAAGDPDVSLACIRWASVAVLVAVAFHCLRTALEAYARKGARL